MNLIEGRPFIAVDWGTTNRRAWRLAADGAVEDSRADACGILSVPEGGFAEQVASLRREFGDLPMLLGGMIGSNRGWREVAYIPCPADVGALSQGIAWIDERTGIVPGVAQDRHDTPDVMRGEEVQIVGALALGLVDPDAELCLPGTHAKWVRLRDGRIDGFTTWMTGELFALLGRHSILAPQLAGEARPGPEFAAGVAASGEGDPLARLFALRAAHVLGAPMPDGPSYVSGLLIGAEVRSGLRDGGVPCLVGRPDLCALYAAAIAQVRGDASVPPVIEGDAAFRAGMGALIRELA